MITMNRRQSPECQVRLGSKGRRDTDYFSRPGSIAAPEGECQPPFVLLALVHGRPPGAANGLQRRALCNRSEPEPRQESVEGVVVASGAGHPRDLKSPHHHPTHDSTVPPGRQPQRHTLGVHAVPPVRLSLQLVTSVPPPATPCPVVFRSQARTRSEDGRTTPCCPRPRESGCQDEDTSGPRSLCPPP